MTKLADKIEALEGPSKEVDAEIAALNGYRIVDEGAPIGRVCYDKNRHGVPLPAYTKSLDAAMTLVPEGYDWFKTPRLDRLPHMIVEPAHREGNPRDYYHFGTAHTPALALCAAALRAREEKK